MMALLRLAPFALCIVTLITTVHSLPPTEPPLVPDHPFIAIWNGPVSTCQKLEIPLDFATFQAVTTSALLPDQFLILFYEDVLGLYPRVDVHTQESYRGGIPQNGSLTAHLDKVGLQINQYMTQDTPGLTVIDWESWRPLWDRNWGSKRIYQKLSIEYAQNMNPLLSKTEIHELAKTQFEREGWRFMERTISLGNAKRPSRSWGFYLFPDCYNYGWENPGYTGKCSPKTQKQNDQLMWLWRSSTALFPSIYIAESLRNSPNAKLYVRNRVQEAIRVSALPKLSYTAPTYVYSRIMYRKNNDKFLSEMDLVSTVGETAALGASGVVMWGASKDYTNEAACRSLSAFLKSTLNPYIANVTAAAMLCSEVLCQGKGRCVRKNYDDTHYLHLNPDDFSIWPADRKYVAIGCPRAADLDAWAKHFTCQCYAKNKCSPKLFYPDKIKHIWV